MEEDLRGDLVTTEEDDADDKDEDWFVVLDEGGRAAEDVDEDADGEGIDIEAGAVGGFKIESPAPIPPLTGFRVKGGTGSRYPSAGILGQRGFFALFVGGS